MRSQVCSGAFGSFFGVSGRLWTDAFGGSSFLFPPPELSVRHRRRRFADDLDESCVIADREPSPLDTHCATCATSTRGRMRSFDKEVEGYGFMVRGLFVFRTGTEVRGRPYVHHAEFLTALSTKRNAFLRFITEMLAVCASRKHEQVVSFTRFPEGDYFIFASLAWRGSNYLADYVTRA